MEQIPSEKLTGLKLNKKFPAFNGTRMFITAFTLPTIMLRPSQAINALYRLSSVYQGEEGKDPDVATSIIISQTENYYVKITVS